LNLSIDVTIKGGLVSKKVDAVVKKAIVEETLQKISERLGRKGAQGSGGKGLGVKRNIVDRQLSDISLEVDTTKIWPRTKGTSWNRENVAIVKAMAPRVLRKTAARIVDEL
jgi:hypothetical protein